METIRAIYDSGILRPLNGLDLPDGATVEFEPRIVDSPAPTTADGDEAGWIAGVNRAWAEDWSDPREDIYTLDDGEPIDGPR